MSMFVRRLIAALFLAGLAQAAWAAWPDRPIRLVVPFPPGGTNDAIGRSLAAQVADQMGVSIVIDNRAGANGIIGYEIVARSSPDGYTLLHTSPSFTINPSIYRKLPFDVERDFTAIAKFVQGAGYFLLVPQNSRYKSLQDFLARAREQPVSYGSAGVGNTLHLAAALLGVTGKLNLLHVPFKGMAPSLTAVMSGEVEFIMAPPPVVMQHIQSGRVRALGFTGKARLPAASSVPTVAESGIPAYIVPGGWFGWFSAARTPMAIASRLHQELAKAVYEPKVMDYVRSGGFEPEVVGPAEFQKFVSEDIRRYAAMVKAAGVEPQ
ncbi:MAG: tripartite tricarboxylate transporter substrate-binding protein [Pseudomonadota bacterium]